MKRALEAKGFPAETVSQILHIHRNLMKEMATKEFWTEGLRKSFASLITTDESLGEHVYLSLLDESNLTALLLSSQLRELAEVLAKTEYRFVNQFGGKWTNSEGRPDFSQKPEGYRSRVDIFLEEAKKADTDPLGCESELTVREGWAHEDTGSPFLWHKKLKYPWDRQPDQGDE